MDNPQQEKPSHRLRFGSLTRVLAWVSVLYGIVLNVFLFVRWPLEERSGFVAIVTEFLHLALFISLVLLAFHLLSPRRRIWALVHLLPAVLLVSSYGPLLLPRTPPNVANSPNETRFTILTHNILSSYTLRPTVSEVIREANTDVVVLQEVNYGINLSIANEFKDQYPHQQFLNVAINDFMVLSKFPLSARAQERNLSGYQRVVLDIKGVNVVLYNTHLYSVRAAGMDSAPHTLQLNALLTAINSETGRVLVAGDFNMSDWSVGYSRITQRYRDAFRDVGHGLGFTAPDYRTRRKLMAWIPALSRVDMIFYGEGLRPLEAYVWPTPSGSDHIAVIARFALPTSPPQPTAP